MTLKRYYLKWDYGYVLANSKKELMDILQTERDPWYVEPFWYRPDEDLKITEIRTANKKDILDWNEEYPNDEEESKWKKNNGVITVPKN